MRETSLMDNLNCKMQPHAKVYEESKLEIEEKMIPIEIILQ